MGHDGDRLLSVEDALSAVLERAVPLPPKKVPSAEALGCILAEDVAADLDLPPFDKSLVDGYAVRTADLEPSESAECWLKIGEEIAAGHMPTRPLGQGEAALIMTGAPLPLGADAAVMFEETRCRDGLVAIDPARVHLGQNRLARGREMRAGDLVLRRGERLNSVRLGLLASVGRTEVGVVPRPRVIIVPTGDELVEPDQVPGPGQIRNSNALMLRTLAVSSGAEAESLPIARDESAPLTEALRQGLTADVLAITGGVSAGNRDLVPDCLERLGVVRVFHKIRLRPGKPLWFGVGPRRGDAPGTLVFGLPGNPVSGIVGFLLLVRPALRALAASVSATPDVSRFPLANPFTHTGSRTTYHPARLQSGSDVTTVEPVDWAGSADLRAVAQSDGFAVFPAGDRAYDAGEIVDFLHLG
jgi:molybdopterin molybdotransferase